MKISSHIMVEIGTPPASRLSIWQIFTLSGAAPPRIASFAVSVNVARKATIAVIAYVMIST